MFDEDTGDNLKSAAFFGMKFIISLVIATWLAECYEIGILYKRKASDIARYNRIAEYASIKLALMSNFTFNIQITEYDDTAKSIYEAVSRLIDKNVVAIVSTSESKNVGQEADLASLFNIPLIAITATDPFLKTAYRPHLIRMAPSDIFQGSVIYDLLKYYKWSDICILASSDNYGINGIVTLLSKASQEKDMTVWCLEYFDPAITKSTKDILPHLRIVKDRLSKVIILNCGLKFADLIFEGARSLGIMSTGHIWITTDAITSGFRIEEDRYDHHTYDGLLGTEPSSGNSDLFRTFNKDFKHFYNYDRYDIDTWSAFLYDALVLVQRALQLTRVDAPKSNSKVIKPWAQGKRLYEAMKNLKFEGISGAIAFDDEGLSMNRMYNIKNFQDGEFKPVGFWMDDIGINIKHPEIVRFLGNPGLPPADVMNSLSGKHLRLGTIYEPPYSIKNLSARCLGMSWSPDCWSGFDHDILKILSKSLNFSFHVVEPKDNQYGTFNKNLGRFTGLVYDLQIRKIDMIGTPLIINYERSSVIDFLSDVAVAKSTSVYVGSFHKFENPLFFLAPLDIYLWLVLIMIIFLLGFVVSFLSRVSPISSSSQFQSTPLSVFSGTFLIACGIVGSKGRSGIPNSPAVRFVLIVWWFFTTIVISMYTANLTAFITWEQATSDIHSLRDLLYQDKYSWGTINGSAEQDLLMTKKQTDLDLIVKNSVNVKSIFAAVDKVKEGRHVFIYDDLSIGFMFRQFCNISTFYNELPTYGLSFAVSKNSPMKKIMSNAILKLAEEGYIEILKRKWFQDDHNHCPEGFGVQSKAFNIKVMMGLFLMLGVAITLGFIITLVEYSKICYRKRKHHPGSSFFHIFSEVVRETLIRNSRNLSQTNAQRDDSIDGPKYLKLLLDMYGKRKPACDGVSKTKQDDFPSETDNSAEVNGVNAPLLSPSNVNRHFYETGV